MFHVKQPRRPRLGRRGVFALLILALPVLVACRSVTGATGWAPPAEVPGREGEVIIRNSDDRISVIDIESASEKWTFPDDEKLFPGLIDEIGADAFYAPPVFLPGGDEFVIGYGLDYGGRYRNLPYIGVLQPQEPKAIPQR